MIKDFLILLVVSIFLISLYLFNEILNKDIENLSNNIEKYNILIRKLQNISNIEKKFIDFKKREKIEVLDKDKAEDIIVSLYDKYQNIYDFKIKTLLVDKDNVSMNIFIDKDIENRLQSELFAKLFEKNSLKKAILINRYIKYSSGKLKSELDLILPFREK